MRKPQEGFVYFILAENGLCKIGKATNPQSRLDAFNSYANRKFILFHQIASNDCYWLETKFHRCFHDVRVKGEWFDLNAQVLVSLWLMERHDRLITEGRDLDNPTSKEADGTLTNPAKLLGSKGGKRGGKARAEALTPERRSEIARMGALAKKTKGLSFPPPKTDC